MWGIHQKESVTHLKDLLRQFDIMLLVILEPKARHTELARFAYSMGFPSWMHGGTINRHVWILWKPILAVEPLWITEQAITTRLTLPNSVSMVVTFVYASCLKRIRVQLWEHLDQVSARVTQNNDLWMISGDLNIIAHTQEKQGGRDPDLGAIHDFQDCVMRNGLFDAGYVGDPFTWCNNRKGRERIWQRIDRTLYNLQVQTSFPSASVTHLPRISSDHSPLLIRLEQVLPKSSSGFIFQRMWVDHPDFSSLVANDWSSPVTGSPGMVLHKKLARLKKTLTHWNWNSFGNLFVRKREVQADIQKLESQLQQGWADSVHQEWESRSRELVQIEAWENEMLCNKARLDWARDGDRNSKYFHAVIRERRKRKLTQLTLANGDITTSPSEIGRLAVEFFSDLFTASPYHLDEELFANIQPRVSPAEDQIFNSLPTMEEISETIKQLNPSSSPGNDGFT